MRKIIANETNAFSVIGFLPFSNYYSRHLSSAFCQLADIKGASGRQEFLGSFKRKVSATLHKCPTKERPKPKPCPKHLEVVLRKDIELVGHTEATAKAICIIASQTSHHQHLAWCGSL